MQNKRKHIIGSFLKKYCGYFQIFFLISILVTGVLFSKFEIQEEQTIIIELLILLSLELLIYSVGNDTFQDDIYNLCNAKFDVRNMVHIEREEGYDRFPLLLSQAQDDLFVSGITCSGIWIYIGKLVELLKQGCHIRLLVSDQDAIESNIFISSGNAIYNVGKDVAKQEVSANMQASLYNLQTNTTIREAYNKNQFEIRRTKVPFTMSCVGINLFSKDENKKQLKVTHNVTYHEMRQCPSMMLNPVDNVNLYNFYVETLEQLWKEAEPF